MVSKWKTVKISKANYEIIVSIKGFLELKEKKPYSFDRVVTRLLNERKPIEMELPAF